MERLKNTEGISSDYESAPRSNATIENVKVKIAESLKNAAAALKQESPQKGSVSGYVSQASGWLRNAADYVEDLNVARVKLGIQRQTRENPGRALLIAGAAGLILGGLLRRR